MKKFLRLPLAVIAAYLFVDWVLPPNIFGLFGDVLSAQVVDSNPNPTPVGVVSSNVAVCDPFHPMNCMAPNSSGILPVTGLFSATISSFMPAALYSTPLSVTGTTSNVALPMGATIAVYNTGANAAYTKLGTSAAVTATTANDVIPAGGGCGFSVGTNTYIAAITASSTTTLNISGGSGLLEGCWVGGGSGGGGGNVTVIGPLGTNTIANSVAVTPATSSLFPISAASLPLPTGASTVAKQPALGTAGVSSADVISVQGIASGTIIPVDASSTAIQGSAAGVAPPAGNNFLSVQGSASGTPIPVSGSFSSTISGFNAAVYGTPFTATNSSTTSASFTSSTEVVVSNVGTTNPAYCTPGATATVSDQYIAPGGGWFAFYAVGGITQISCITASSTTTINIAAGSGVPTGTGGGVGAATTTASQGAAASSGPWIITPWIAGAVDSATNGLYTNLTQGNAVLSGSNPIFAALSIGGAAVSATNPIPESYIVVAPTTTTTTPSTAVTANTTAVNCATGVWTMANSFVAGQTIQFAAVPCATTGPTTGTTYYVIATGLSGSQFEVSATLGGAVLTGTGAGTSVVGVNTVIAPGDVICSNSAAATCSSGLTAITAARIAAGSFYIPQLTLSGTLITSGWNNALIEVDLWTAKPTYTYGHAAPWTVATGAASRIGRYLCTLTQMGDGVTGPCSPIIGPGTSTALASGTSIYADLQNAGGTALTPVASAVFTITPSVWQN